MTEEEAKTKWCPYGAGVRQYGAMKEMSGGGFEYNRFTDPSTAHCIGSACMAWRGGGIERDIKPGPYYNSDEPMEIIRHLPGHCGLAGKP